MIADSTYPFSQSSRLPRRERTRRAMRTRTFVLIAGTLALLAGSVRSVPVGSGIPELPTTATNNYSGFHRPFATPLEQAVRTGNRDLAAQILALDPDIVATEAGERALSTALEQCDADLLHVLALSDYDVQVVHKAIRRLQDVHGPEWVAARKPVWEQTLTGLIRKVHEQGPLMLGPRATSHDSSRSDVDELLWHSGSSELEWPGVTDVEPPLMDRAMVIGRAPATEFLALRPWPKQDLTTIPENLPNSGMSVSYDESDDETKLLPVDFMLDVGGEDLGSSVFAGDRSTHSVPHAPKRKSRLGPGRSVDELITPSSSQYSKKARTSSRETTTDTRGSRANPAREFRRVPSVQSQLVQPAPMTMYGLRRADSSVPRPQALAPSATSAHPMSLHQQLLRRQHQQRHAANLNAALVAINENIGVDTRALIRGIVQLWEHGDHARGVAPLKSMTVENIVEILGFPSVYNAYKIIAEEYHRMGMDEFMRQYETTATGSLVLEHAIRSRRLRNGVKQEQH